MPPGDSSRSSFRRKSRKDLRNENAELRKLLKLTNTPYWSVEEWESANPQDVRDGLAARVFLNEWGDRHKALRRLGFAPPERIRTHARPAYVRGCMQIFDTPGVREILSRELSHIEEQRDALLRRQVKTALYGCDHDSVNAFSLLARVMGWFEKPSTERRDNVLTLANLVMRNNESGLPK